MVISASIADEVVASGGMTELRPALGAPVIDKARLAHDRLEAPGLARDDNHPLKTFTLPLTRLKNPPPASIPPPSVFPVGTNAVAQSRLSGMIPNGPAPTAPMARRPIALAAEGNGRPKVTMTAMYS